MGDIYQVACTLRERHRKPGDVGSFTHVPCVMPPLHVLARLKTSALADPLPDDGAPLTHPERPWYGPIMLVTASESNLVAAGVTASTWEPPQWNFTAAELVLRLVYQMNGAEAQLCLVLDERHDTTLSRVFYDNQRASTGYEGEDRTTTVLTRPRLDAFLELIRDAT